jgi:ATP-dependent RNA helicase DeaD
MHGDMTQAMRERVIAKFRKRGLDFLVATDVAARGLDVDRISHIVNYDIPQDAESYVHRIGRTGRAGRAGEALLFVTPRERHLLRAIEKATRQPITEMALPSVADVNNRRVAKFADSITERLGSPDLAFFRGLVEDYEREHNVPIVDVAAALAILAQDDRSLLLQPEPEREPQREPQPRRESGDARRGGDRNSEPNSRKAQVRMAKYRISVGRRQRVSPGDIVGALANEGGLSRGDFGHIDIHAGHTLVELPARLPDEVLARLRRTRISGQLIELRSDPTPLTGRSGAAAKRTTKPHRKG